MRAVGTPGSTREGQERKAEPGLCQGEPPLPAPTMPRLTTGDGRSDWGMSSPGRAGRGGGSK